jgi:hypothetical protein
MLANRSENAPRKITNLPTFDPNDALTLRAVCRLGLVPGHGGRRQDPHELEHWARDGAQLARSGPRFLFPSIRINGNPVTTPAWCASSVAFIAAEQRARFGRANESGERIVRRFAACEFHYGNAGFQPSAKVLAKPRPVS